MALRPALAALALLVACSSDPSTEGTTVTYAGTSSWSFNVTGPAARSGGTSGVVSVEVTTADQQAFTVTYRAEWFDGGLCRFRLTRTGEALPAGFFRAAAEPGARCVYSLPPPDAYTPGPFFAGTLRGGQGTFGPSNLTLRLDWNVYPIRPGDGGTGSDTLDLNLRDQ